MTPDLTTLGKVIGGGLPVGAYGGRREVMELVAPAGPVYQAGTLSGNPLAMTAGIETLRVLAEPGVWDGLERAGERLEAGLRSLGDGVQVARAGTMFGVFFSDVPVTSWDTAKAADTARFAAFHRCDARPRRLPRAVAVRGGLRLDRARRRRDRRDDRGGTRCARVRLSVGSTLRAVKVLLVTMYFPPAGGGGVQRSLKLAQYLPALGVETHVLAPDDPKWVHTRPRAARSDAGVDPPRAIPRAARAEAGRGAPGR